MIRKMLSVLGILAVMAGMTSCEYKKPGTTVGTMVCDESFENIMRQEIIVYENVYPRAVIGCQYVTESEAMQRLLSGDTKLAVTGRDITPEQKERLQKNQDTKSVRSMQIAVDAMALIVNNENPVSMLSVNEIKRILTGELKNWKQIQPDAPDLPIRVVVDNPRSGMTLYMREKLMDGAQFDPTTVMTADSVAGVFNKVRENRSVIGVIGVSWLSTGLSQPEVDSLMTQFNDSIIDGADINRRVAGSGVKTLRVMTELGAFKPTQEDIYSGNYPFTRPIYMITTALPASTLGKFYSFVTGNDGQKIMMHTGIMPARVHARVYEIE